MQLWSSKHASQQYTRYTVFKSIVKGIYTPRKCLNELRRWSWGLCLPLQFVYMMQIRCRTLFPLVLMETAFHHRWSPSSTAWQSESWPLSLLSSLSHTPWWPWVKESWWILEVMGVEEEWRSVASVRMELVSTAGLEEGGAVRTGLLVKNWRENGDELPGLGPVWRRIVVSALLPLSSFLTAGQLFDGMKL